ncbi:nucleoside triphosphate pyrophosphohydrolase [Candidatus Saccharibacteria bacterium]|nr:MAG: nucleoside triphosphate pyrophosphohydrolase [Candidatus Saccharibacteria bacterium]
MHRAKLVRDKIPEIIASKGMVADVRILNEEEYMARLLDKLSEEYREFLEDMNIEELADMLEVIYALADEISSKESLEKIRQLKFAERGVLKNDSCS